MTTTPGNGPGARGRAWYAWICSSPMYTVSARIASDMYCTPVLRRCCSLARQTISPPGARPPQLGACLLAAGLRAAQGQPGQAGQQDDLQEQDQYRAPPRARCVGPQGVLERDHRLQVDR